MGFFNKVKTFFLNGHGFDKIKRSPSNWIMMMMPFSFSHGYHAVEWNHDPSNDDLVAVQRAQIGEEDVWFFGIANDQVGDSVSNHLQTNLFNKKFKKLRSRNSKVALKKAYISARVTGSAAAAASAIVMKGEKLVMGNMGGYRSVICRNGEAYQVGGTTAKKDWSSGLIRGMLCFNSRTCKSEEVMVGEERIDSRIEFVILASDGIWEVMKNQEAVNLISHLEDPQEAAECLSKEALNRMSKINISCIVLRFNYQN